MIIGLQYTGERDIKIVSVGSLTEELSSIINNSKNSIKKVLFYLKKKTATNEEIIAIEEEASDLSDIDYLKTVIKRTEFMKHNTESKTVITDADLGDIKPHLEEKI